MIFHKVAKSSLCAEVKEKHSSDLIMMQISEDVGQKKVMAFEIGGDDVL